jgi:hypothetical protein
VSLRGGVALAATALLWWGARRGFDELLLAVSALVGPVWWIAARPGWGTAWRVVASEQYIEGGFIGGRRVRLAWDGVGEVQHFVKRTPRGPIRVLRLLSIDRQREVTFDDRLSGFEPLVRLVETKVRHLGAGTPSSWGRLLWSPSPGGGPRR